MQAKQAMKRRSRATETSGASAQRNRPRGNSRRVAAAPHAKTVAPRIGAPLPVSGAGRGKLRRVLGRLGLWASGLAILTALTYGVLYGAQRGYEYATTSPRFEVRALVFAPTPHVDDARVRALMGLHPGTNILSLDLTGLAERIAEDPWVAKAKVVRRLPDTLEVSVEEERAAAVLLAGVFYLVNEQGVPFKELAVGERERMPVITGIEPSDILRDPAGVNERIARGLEVAAAYARKQRPRLSEIHVDADHAVTLYTEELGSQLRAGRGPIDAALARYDALRAALGSDSEKLAVAHLDGSDAIGEHERVVASFFPAQDPPSFVAEVEAARAHAVAQAQTAEENQAKPQRSRRSRLPRYE